MDAPHLVAQTHPSDVADLIEVAAKSTTPIID